MGFIRFVPAGILLAGVVALVGTGGPSRRPEPRGPSPTPRSSARLLLMGGMGLVAWAEQTIPTGIAALLIALMPMWLAIFGLVFLGERLPRAGVDRDRRRRRRGRDPRLADRAASTTSTRPASLALLVSPICWALGAIYAARRAVLPAPALFASGLEMIAGGLVLLVASAVTGELATFDPAAVSTESWVGIAYLLLVGSLVGYTTFAWLVQVAPLPRVATYAYVNPVVAVILGAIVLQEPLTPRTWVASVVIIAAVVLIVTAAGARPTAP